MAIADETVGKIHGSDLDRVAQLTICRMALASQAMQLSETKLNAFMERAVGDMGAAMHAALIVIGDKLGLYKALAAMFDAFFGVNERVVNSLSA